MPSRLLAFPRRRSLWLAAALLAVALRADDEPIAIYSEVFNGYTRERLPDNSLKPQTYTFGEGGRIERTVKDPVLEKMDFKSVARTIAGPLARLNYHPSAKSAETDLLILVFWGATQGSQDATGSDTASQAASASSTFNAARLADLAKGATEPSPEAKVAGDNLDFTLSLLATENRTRDRLDAYNARILGYSESLDRAHAAEHMGFSQDLLNELGASRYFVVLQAYDFPTALKYKKLKPLWTTRISIGERGNDFSAALEQMIRVASGYFGRASHGLQRDVIQQGTVKLGETKILEVVPEKK